MIFLSNFSNRNLIETTPIIIWSLFLGPFLDSFASATYLIMFLNLAGDICSSVINLALVYFFDTSNIENLLK